MERLLGTPLFSQEVTGPAQEPPGVTQMPRAGAGAPSWLVRIQGWALSTPNMALLFWDLPERAWILSSV